MFAKLRSKGGFSLVELIVVIVILGVLIGIAVPNLINFVDQARIQADMTNASILASNAQIAYSSTIMPNVNGQISSAVIKEHVTPLITNGWPKPRAEDGEFVVTGRINSDGGLIFTVSVKKTTGETIQVYPNPEQQYRQQR